MVKIIFGQLRLLTSCIIFVPILIIIRLVEDRSEYSSPGSLSMMSGIVAPGKQRVAVPKMFVIRESPTINMALEKKGWGGGGCWFSGQEGAQSFFVCVEVANEDGVTKQVSVVVMQ